MQYLAMIIIHSMTIITYINPKNGLDVIILKKYIINKLILVKKTCTNSEKNLLIFIWV